MKIMAMEEFSRTGGGQTFFSRFYNAVIENNELSLITDKNSKSNLQFSELFRTSFAYREGINLLTLVLSVKRLRKEIGEIMARHNYDIVFNNHPNMFLYNGDVNYLHGFSFLDSIIDENGEIKNKYLFHAIKESRIYDIYDGANFLTHGKFTLDLSKKLFPILGILPHRLDYIFIPVDKFYNIDFSDKRNAVLTFGRINEQKNLELVLNTAKNMGDIEFVIAGAVNDGDEGYFHKLERIAPSNLKIVKNPNEEEKVNLYRRAKVYLHAKRNEHYGIAVADAISYGCVPVVPESGGPWVDIIEMGNYGIGYKENPVDAIKNALDVNLEFSKTILQSRVRFSAPIFTERLLDFLDSTVKNKGN